MDYRNKLKKKEMEMLSLESVTEQREELKKWEVQILSSPSKYLSYSNLGSVLEIDAGFKSSYTIL